MLFEVSFVRKMADCRTVTINSPKMDMMPERREEVRIVMPGESNFKKFLLTLQKLFLDSTTKKPKKNVSVSVTKVKAEISTISPRWPNANNFAQKVHFVFRFQKK